MSHNVARLVVREGWGRTGQEILLTDDVTTLGRAASCQVVLDNDFTSRRHAQIVRREEVYWLRDLDSKNGTLLDNERVTVEVCEYPFRRGETRFRSHRVVDRTLGYLPKDIIVPFIEPHDFRQPILTNPCRDPCAILKRMGKADFEHIEKSVRFAFFHWIYPAE
jgi:pSer/pThr/pTyr-binding forkhead associated (FHA) protein